MKTDPHGPRPRTLVTNPSRTPDHRVHRYNVSVTLLSSFLLLCACGGNKASTTGNRAVPSTVQPPDLMVSVVLDQWGTDTLARLLPHLSPEGAVRTGIAEGAFYPKGVYPYAGTYTAAGHATIYTGASPRVHGVVANRIYDHDSGENRSVVYGGKHPVHGAEGDMADPGVLRVETLADALKAQHGESAKVVSLSYKDRGALFAGGQRPDASIWFHGGLPGFTTSTFYSDSFPVWLQIWQEGNPTEKALALWKAEDPALLAKIAGRDDQPGEGDMAGFSRTFPHDPRRSKVPIKAFKSTPMATALLLDLARQSVETFDLGDGGPVDLLAISVSGTDYAGHVFGPHSWEYADNLIRVDRMLGEFCRWISRGRRVVFMITSDHGVAPLPEIQSPEEAHHRRVDTTELVARLNDGLRAALCADKPCPDRTWAVRYSQPFIYLRPDLGNDERIRVIQESERILSNHPGLHSAMDARVLHSLPEPQDPVLRSAWHSVASEPPGDIFVVPARDHVISPPMPGLGTSHGTPWSYDQQVPIVLWGHRVPHVRHDTAVDPRQIATTMSKLMGIRPPEQSREPVLPGL